MPKRKRGSAAGPAGHAAGKAATVSNATAGGAAKSGSGSGASAGASRSASKAKGAAGSAGAASGMTMSSLAELLPRDDLDTTGNDVEHDLDADDDELDGEGAGLGGSAQLNELFRGVVKVRRMSRLPAHAATPLASASLLSRFVAGSLIVFDPGARANRVATQAG